MGLHGMLDSQDPTRKGGKTMKKAWAKFLDLVGQFFDYMAVWPCQNDKKKIDGYFFEEKKE